MAPLIPGRMRRDRPTELVIGLISVVQVARHALATLKNGRAEPSKTRGAKPWRFKYPRPRTGPGCWRFGGLAVCEAVRTQ